MVVELKREEEMQVNKYLDGSNCSIFCKLESYKDVLHYLNSTTNDEISLEILEGSVDFGMKYRIKFPQEHIDFYILIRNQGGDQTSKIILGAYNFFKRIISDVPSNQKFIQQHIQHCNSSIGIKCSTEFSDLSYVYIMQFANEFNGLIFNSSGMLDVDGELILDVDGAYSVLYE